MTLPLEVVPIDDCARDGAHQLVLRMEGPSSLGGWPCAIARWIEGEWLLANGKLDFEPTHYQPRKDPR